MKKRRARRPPQTASYGQMFGVELFEDSRLLRVVLCQLHFDKLDAADDGPPFPLADVADPAMTNANLVVYLLQQHADDERAVLVHHHRYFHQDSQDPSDGLDLKRTAAYHVSLPETRIDALIEDFCRFVSTDPHFTLCAPLEVYDFSTALIDVAVDAFTKLPFIHTRVVAPDGGVQ